MLRIYIIIYAMLSCTLCSSQVIGLQVEGSQSVLFGDSINGGGSKLIWDSDKAALRAGAVTGSSTVESFWDSDSIGNYSVSFGRNNKVTADYGMSWGRSNESSGDYTTSWGWNNESSGDYSTSWGELNESSGDYSTSWGWNNESSGDYSTSWGWNNESSGDYSTSWGWNNESSGYESTSWGEFNESSGDYTTSWGVFNESSGNYTTSWGVFNESSGNYTTSWGRDNKALSAYETTIGRYADTLTHSDPVSWESDDQLFVVGNGTSPSARSNALTVMKSGEVKIDEQLTLQGYDSAFGVGDDDGVIYAAPDKSSSDLILVSNDGVAIHIDELDENDSFFDVFNGSGTRILSLNEDGNLTINGTYSPSSDINRKENITSIDYRSILQRLKEISITEWQFKGESIRHIGPMAQDFYAAFGLGQGETTISTVDADGVALAAIQALADENQELKTQNRELTSRIDTIEKLLEKLLNR